MIEIIPNWHPLFVHFSIALLSMSVLFFIIEKPVHETILGDNFLIFARYALWLGAIITVGTVLAGWFAYNSVDHDDASHLAMTDHRNWAIGTFIVFILAAVWLAVSSRLKEGASILFILYLIVGVGLLATTGFKGAELVYNYGLGVKSLPSKSTHDSSDGHAHDHAHADSAKELPLGDDMSTDSMTMEHVDVEVPVAEKELPVEQDEDGITRQKLAP